MFNINNAVEQLKLLEYTKIHGLPIQRKHKDPKIQHIDDTPYIEQAEKEGIAISKAYRSRTIDFGKRLKVGQYRRCPKSRVKSKLQG